MSPCVLDAQQKCVKMNMPSFGAPALQKTHTETSAPFNYGHLLMVLGGGLIVGLAAGNVGFVFTSEDLNEVRDALLENKVKAPARAGAIAPVDVVIPAQNTGLGPEKTSFFQALSIP